MAQFAYGYSLLLLVNLLLSPERACQVEKKTCLGCCLGLFRFPFLDKLWGFTEDPILEGLFGGYLTPLESTIIVVRGIIPYSIAGAFGIVE